MSIETELHMRDKQQYNLYQREYQRLYQSNLYHKRMNIAREILGGVCVVCGTRENLEMDHVNSSEKSFGIAQGYSRKDFLEEVAKCQLLCRKHHNLKTIESLDNPQMVSVNKDVHGSGYMYIQKKCRCALCKTWYYFYKHKEVKYGDAVKEALAVAWKKDFIRHGTRAGYLKERRLKLESCESCREANATYTRGHRKAT